MVVFSSALAMQAQAIAHRAAGKTIGFVPTMGALHSGHAALIKEARRRSDVVVVSIFVNPAQFGKNEDLTKYPRTFDDDVDLCTSCGADIVFAPTVDEMYPDGFATTVSLDRRLTGVLEGEHRPGHFDGVATVVALLFGVVQPHSAVFGEKDFQQLTVVRRLVRDLKMPVDIIAMPVIRDVDSLALSSRNRFLSAVDRSRAVVVPKAVQAAQDALQDGEHDAARIIAAAQRMIDSEPAAAADYIAIVDPHTFAPVTVVDKTARIVLTVRLGGVRLLDNGPLFPGLRRA
jgi:pantoate--beta-alanine ligase